MGAVGPSILLALSMLSSQEHKEERFMFPVYALAPALLAVGTLAVSESLGRARAWVATLLLVGDAVTGILGLAMSQPVYESIPDSTPKILYEVSGASHFDIQPQTGNNLFGMYGLSWQKVFLEGDMRYKQFLMLPKPSNASDFKSNVK